MDYVVINDPHFTLQSNIRTGNILDDLIYKLDRVVEACNTWDSTLLITGDVFDKATVPDEVKSRLIKSLKQAKHVPIVIFGNHDLLWSNEEKNVKTSLNLLIEAGVVKNLTGTTIQVEQDGKVLYELTNKLPIVDKGHAQLVLFHGFLNKEDGRCTFNFTDIQTDDPCLIVLGHDHVTYDPIKYKNSTILRFGSFCRGIRIDEHLRIPQMARVRFEGSRFVYKLYNIPCRDASLIFKEKAARLQQVVQGGSYSEIIEQMKKSAEEKEVSLSQLFRQVTAEDEVLSFLEDSLNEFNNAKTIKQ